MLFIRTFHSYPHTIALDSTSAFGKRSKETDDFAPEVCGVSESFFKIYADVWRAIDLGLCNETIIKRGCYDSATQSVKKKVLIAECNQANHHAKFLEE